MLRRDARGSTAGGTALYLCAAALAGLGACSLIAPSDEDIVGGTGGAANATSTTTTTGGGMTATTATTTTATATSTTATSGSGGNGGVGGATATSSSAGGAGGGTGGSGGSAPAIPTNGLLLWLRTDAGVSLVNNHVSVWADQSGSGNDATQPGINSRPLLSPSAIGGQPALDFDGADDFLVLPSGFADFSQGISLFAVVQASANLPCPPVIHLCNDPEVDDISLQREDTNAVGFEVFDTSLHTPDGVYPVGSATLLSAIQSPSGDANVIVDGQVVANLNFPIPATIARTKNFVGLGLYGGCAHHAGLIAEILIYQRALSFAEEPVVRGYLQQKYSCCQ